MATKKINKATVFTTNYVFCVYGGAMKVGLCYATTSDTHPEEELKELYKYYGNEIKGYYCKTTDSLETLSTKLAKELKDKSNLSDYLYEVKVTDIKKIIKTVAESKTGTTMGPVKQKATGDDEEDDDESEDEAEPIKKAIKEEVKKEVKKETKSKDEKKDEKKDDKKDDKKADTKKVVAKEVKEKDTKKKEVSAKITKEEPVKKSNKTVINLSDDDSDDDEEEN
jgi:hypothetical protein